MGGTADILGHDRIVERLWGALGRDALHHAYLFEGPEGVGKRTVALRLAMAANCEREGAGPLPCAVCATCRSIAAGQHPDVIALAPTEDRATPIIAVDQVREVVRKAGYHRYAARRRFIVVDPADAMQDAAANALLKTLEEPPEGTGFILVVTHARALLPTILSRCQRVRFSAVPEEALVPWLEAREVPDPLLVARAALGCPGAALELGEGRLAERRALRDHFLAALGGRLGEVFDFSAKVTRGGPRAWRERVGELLEIAEELLRDVTVTGAGAQTPILHVDRQALLDAWASTLWPGGVVRCADAVQEARHQLARNVSGKTLVDALVTRWATELGPARRAS